MQLKFNVTPTRWIEVRGDGAVAQLVADELAECTTGAVAGEQLLSFCVTDAPPPSAGGPRLGAVRAVPQGIAWDVERMDYRLVFEATPPLRATMHVGRRGPPFHVPSWLFPLLERTALTWQEAQAYHAMLLLEFSSLMAGSVGVLHASAVERAGKVLALTSTGGVGKTTSACRLVERSGFRHLADDVLLIDADGGVMRSFRKLMVYPYNARDMPALETIVRRQSRRSRLLWDLDRSLRLGRRRRRARAKDLFGEKVATRGSLEAIVFLRKADAPGLELRELGAESLAVRSNEIITSEFHPFMDLLRLSTALLGDEFAWSPGVVARRNVDVLRLALSTARRIHAGDFGQPFDPTEALSRLIPA